MEKEVLIKKFISNYYLLNPSEKIILRRSFNKSFSGIDSKVLIPFYKVLPSEVTHDRYIWFFCATLCAYQDSVIGSKFTTALKECYSDKLLDSFNIILKTSLSEENLTLYKFGKLIKRIDKKIDISNLLDDLLSFRYSETILKRKWAKEVYSN